MGLLVPQENLRTVFTVLNDKPITDTTNKGAKKMENEMPDNTVKDGSDPTKSPHITPVGNEEGSPPSDQGDGAPEKRKRVKVLDVERDDSDHIIKPDTPVRIPGGG